MNTKMIIDLGKNIKKNIIKNSPDILLGAGLTGTILSTIMAVKITPKACKAIEKEKRKRKELSKFDKFKIAWKYYVPSAIVGSISCGCILYSHSENAKRSAALFTAYSLSESRLSEYQNKLIESIGEEEEESVRTAIDKDAIEANPYSKNNVFYTENGNELCYDKMSGRYFYSSVNAINRSVNEFNKSVMDEMYMSLNDFYCILNLPSIDAGDVLGWHIDKGLFKVSFTSQLNSDGTPCVVLTYPIMPEYTQSSYY